jgi:uroporphyrinogen-III synthase
MNKLLITRPEPEASELAIKLTKKGFNCIKEPLFSVEFLINNLLCLEISQHIIIFTSKNAIKAYCSANLNKQNQIITVGKITANYAKECGFTNIDYAEGNVISLLKLLQNSYKNADIIYVRGEKITLDIAKHHLVKEIICYKTIPIESFSTNIINEIMLGNIRKTLFFSENTVTIFANLIEKHGLEKYVNKMQAICISDKIAERAKTMNWQEVIITNIL